MYKSAYIACSQLEVEYLNDGTVRQRQRGRQGVGVEVGGVLLRVASSLSNFELNLRAGIKCACACVCV